MKLRDGVVSATMTRLTIIHVNIFICWFKWFMSSYSL